MTQDVAAAVEAYLDFVRAQPHVSLPVQSQDWKAIRPVGGSIPTPRMMDSPTRDLDRQLVPQFIEQVCQRVGQEYGEATQKAFGMMFMRFLTNIEGRTPALVEGNFGDCIAALDRSVDLSGVPVIIYNSFDDSTDILMDDTLAGAQTLQVAPHLFGPMFGARLGKMLNMLGKIHEDDVNGRSFRPNLWKDKVEALGTAVPAILGQALMQLEPTNKHAENAYHVLGLLEHWDLEDPQGLDVEKLKQWRIALDGGWMTPIQKKGKIRLDRLMLAHIGQKNIQTGETGRARTPKM